MISVAINADFLSGIKASRAEFVEALDQGFQEAGETVADKFRMDVSGRKSDDTGLNIRTGNLLGSVDSFAQTTSDGVTSAVFNQHADYWYYHQKGLGHNPKRLSWDEYWAGEAETLYTSAVDEALGRIAA